MNQSFLIIPVELVFVAESSELTMINKKNWEGPGLTVCPPNFSKELVVDALNPQRLEWSRSSPDNSFTLEKEPH